MHARTQDVAGRTDFRDARHRHHRRRARARLRRRDLDRAAAERPLLARRAHRRRVALRARRAARSTRRPTSAARRCTSPSARVHMFPEELATGLCSLNPHVDRLVQSCLMEVDRRGQVVRYEFHDGVIRSDERMTYTDVNAILTDARSRRRRGRYRAARADVRADARAVRDPERPAPAARLDRLRPRRGGGRARRGGAGSRRSSPPSATSRTGSSRSSCCSPTRRWPSTSTRASVPGALPRPRGARPAEGRAVRGVRREPRLQPRGARCTACGRGTSSAGRADRGQARGEADRLPDAADDAEGAVRAGEPRALRPGRSAATRTSRRRSAAIPTSSCTGCCARRRRGATPRREREELDGGSAGDRAPHLRARAAGRRGRARAGAVEEGPLHGGQGRRRVRRLHHRRRGVRPVRRAGRALRRGARARLDAWPTTTTGSSRRRTSLRGENTRQGLPARRPRARAGRARGHGAAADRPRPRGDPRGGARERAAPRRAPRQDRERSRRHARASRSGRRAPRREARAARQPAETQRAARRSDGIDDPCATSSSAPPATSITARARSCARSPAPIPTG